MHLGIDLVGMVKHITESEGENKMKEFKNFVPVEIKNHLELIIENIDNISEMKREKDVDFFMNETMRLIEMLKNDVESFAEFQKN